MGCPVGVGGVAYRSYAVCRPECPVGRWWPARSRADRRAARDCDPGEPRLGWPTGPSAAAAHSHRPDTAPGRASPCQWHRTTVTTGQTLRQALSVAQSWSRGRTGTPPGRDSLCLRLQSPHATPIGGGTGGGHRDTVSQWLTLQKEIKH